MLWLYSYHSLLLVWCSVDTVAAAILVLSRFRKQITERSVTVDEQGEAAQDFYAVSATEVCVSGWI